MRYEVEIEDGSGRYYCNVEVDAGTSVEAAHMALASVKANPRAYDWHYYTGGADLRDLQVADCNEIGEDEDEDSE